jgi:membrane protease subunit (stomatin/prohibitin family)
MGLIQAAVGSIGGALADQWKDFYTVPDGLPPTAALFAAVPRGTNAGRGSNTRGSSNIITNGSRIVVPEGYGLLLMQEGAVTAFVAEAGRYEWNSNDLQFQVDLQRRRALFDSLVRRAGSASSSVASPVRSRPRFSCR